MLRDFKVMAELMASGHDVGRGVVLGARHLDRSSALREQAGLAGVEVTLDPESVELSTVGGFARSGMSELPWANDEVDSLTSLRPRLDEVAEEIARTAVEMGADSVLAPTHFLDQEPDGWLTMDVDATRRLRAALDSDPAGRHIRVHYPVVVSQKALRTDAFAQQVRQRVGELVGDRAVDSIWLRIHGFGATQSGRVNLRRYISLARSLHRLGVPVVGERTGTIGLALLALGCVAGIESGVTYGERSDTRSLLRPPDPGKRVFALAPRVYVPGLGAFLKRDPAAAFFSSPGIKNWYACQRPCCAKGHIDMLRDPRRHFLITRALEVHDLAVVPAEFRPEHYLNSWLRPASDRAIRAERTLPELANHRARLDGWRETITEVRSRDALEPPTTSAVFGSYPPGARRTSESAQG